MTKTEFKNLIKDIIRKKYNPAKVDLDSLGTQVDLDFGKFPIIEKFPSIKGILIDLLTDQYEAFVNEIQWTAPRPTTLKIILNNGQSFYLIHTDKTWEAKIEGKKYYLLNLPEEERAAEAIARILSYAWASEPEKEPEGGETPSTEETPTEETPAEETPEEEIPAET